MRRNLLNETIRCIANHKQIDLKDLFVTDGKKVMTFSDFAQIAEDINYDAGYGGAEVNMNLKVVGPTWWLERHEYDGAEWWEFKEIPVLPREMGNIRIMDDDRDYI